MQVRQDAKQNTLNRKIVEEGELINLGENDLYDSNIDHELM